MLSILPNRKKFQDLVATAKRNNTATSPGHVYSESANRSTSAADLSLVMLL